MNNEDRMNNGQQEYTLAEIERRYPQQWVLVEETVWDNDGNPLRGIVRAHGMDRWFPLKQRIRKLLPLYDRDLHKTFDAVLTPHQTP
jgi:hypothetical protein